MKDANLTAIAERALQRLRSASPACAALLEGPQAAAKVRRVAIASDFAIDTLLRQPDLLSYLVADEARRFAAAAAHGREPQRLAGAAASLSQRPNRRG